MSELKVYVKPLKTNIFGETIVGQSYYLKSEADKVIAELKHKLYEAQDELVLWREGTIISEEHQNELDGKRHSDYKRCLAMAKWCKAMCGHYLSYEEPEWFWFRKWSVRWLKIAEIFKSTAQ